MCMRINIEDLAANALIELLERENRREVMFAGLSRYGQCVMQVLRVQDAEEDVVLVYARESKLLLFSDYTDYFEPITEGATCVGIRLREGVDSTMLWRRFRSRITVRLLKAFMDDNAYAALTKKAA